MLMLCTGLGSYAARRPTKGGNETKVCSNGRWRESAPHFDQFRLLLVLLLLLLFLALALGCHPRFPCFRISCGSTICTVLCFFALSNSWYPS